MTESRAGNAVVLTGADADADANANATCGGVVVAVAATATAAATIAVDVHFLARRDDILGCGQALLRGLELLYLLFLRHGAQKSGVKLTPRHSTRWESQLIQPSYVDSHTRRLYTRMLMYVLAKGGQRSPRFTVKFRE